MVGDNMVRMKIVLQPAILLNHGFQYNAILLTVKDYLFFASAGVGFF